MTLATLAIVRRSWDADAGVYLRAVEVADGQQLEPHVAQLINQFILGCKADGIWSAIKASCIFAGARTLSGALVPLVGSAPTNNNFVGGDYNRKTGLVGNASTKWLNTNRAGNADPQNNNHRCVFVSAAGTPSNATQIYMGNFSDGTPASNIGISSSQVFFRNNGNTSNFVFQGASSATGFLGSSRSSSASFVGRVSASNTSHSVASLEPSPANILIGRDTSASSPFFTNARIAFYSLGDSLTLADFAARVSALYNAIGVALP